MRGRYTGERQPLLPGSYATLPDLPATDALTFACYFYPTLLEAREQTVVRAGNFRIAVSETGLVITIGVARIESLVALQAHRWYRVAIAIGETVEVLIEGVPAGSAEAPLRHRTTHRTSNRLSIARGDWELAREAPGSGHFNGRIEAVRIYDAALDVGTVCAELDETRPSRPELSGAWDFSIGIETSVVTDVSGHGRHGTLYQTPTRAVRGARWRGDVFNWREDPSQYAAIHFHDDDLDRRAAGVRASAGRFRTSFRRAYTR